MARGCPRGVCRAMHRSSPSCSRPARRGSRRWGPGLRVFPSALCRVPYVLLLHRRARRHDKTDSVLTPQSVRVNDPRPRCASESELQSPLGTRKEGPGRLGGACRAGRRAGRATGHERRERSRVVRAERRRDRRLGGLGRIALLTHTTTIVMRTSGREAVMPRPSIVVVAARLMMRRSSGRHVPRHQHEQDDEDQTPPSHLSFSSSTSTASFTPACAMNLARSNEGSFAS